jgi:hypothetical protein
MAPPPGVGWPYVIVLCAIIGSCTLLGALHVIDGPEAGAILVGVLSAAVGHLVGYTAGKSAGQ